MAGGAKANLFGVDGAAAGLDAHHAVTVLEEAGDFAVLDDVHAQLVALAGEGPGNMVVLGDAGTGLVGGAHDRVADVVADVQDGAEFLDLLRVQPFSVNAVELVGSHAAHAFADVAQGVGQVHHAALAEQEVVLEFLGQDLPELEGVLVDCGALVPEVVGTDDGGVAGHVATSQPALFQDRDVGHSVVLGQEVCGGQAVPAAADDHGVVGGLGFRVPPEEFRVFGEVGGAHWAAPIRSASAPARRALLFSERCG
ncbi:hypothetical protein QE394_002224 [Arthrobacter sp. SORGH_AS 212]|nr:hypothetical protein [Arthrobacter sp. SORGH_AS_0212]